MDNNIHARTEHIRGEAIPILQTSLVFEFRNYRTDYNKVTLINVHNRSCYNNLTHLTVAATVPKQMNSGTHESVVELPAFFEI
jgi:hypothetical protein